MEQLKLYDENGSYKALLKAKKENISALNKKKGRLIVSLDLLNAIGLSLIPFEGNGKYGFINKNAKVIIEPIYDEVKGVFSNLDNYVAVRKDKRWSAIDSTGKEMLPFDYLFIFPSPDSSLVTCENYSGWSVIDLKTANVIIKPKTYQLIEGFRYGYARVKNKDLWGIINTEGKLVLDTKYETIYPWYEWYEPTTKIKELQSDHETIIKLDDLK